MNAFWQLFYPSTAATTCPICCGKVPIINIRAEGFSCPQCGQLLREAPKRRGILNVVSALGTVGIVAWLWTLLKLAYWTIVFLGPVVLVIWMPTLAVIGYVATVLFPPKLLKYEADHGLSLFGRPR